MQSHRGDYNTWINHGKGNRKFLKHWKMHGEGTPKLIEQYGPCVRDELRIREELWRRKLKANLNGTVCCADVYFENYCREYGIDLKTLEKRVTKVEKSVTKVEQLEIRVKELEKENKTLKEQLKRLQNGDSSIKSKPVLAYFFNLGTINNIIVKEP
jgi:hypothetical protein